MPANPPVIDMWAPLVASREIVDHVIAHFPEPMLGYLQVFFKREPTPDSVRQLAGLVQKDEAILASLDEANIRLALITGFDEALDRLGAQHGEVQRTIRAQELFEERGLAGTRLAIDVDEVSFDHDKSWARSW